MDGRKMRGMEFGIMGEMEEGRMIKYGKKERGRKIGGI